MRTESYPGAADASSLLPGSMFSHGGVIQLLVKRIYDWVKVGRQRFIFQTAFDVEYGNDQWSWSDNTWKTL